MSNYSIQIRGNTIKVDGLPIKRIPKDKTCIIDGFYIENGRIIKHGVFKLVPKRDGATYIITNNIIKRTDVC